MSELEKRLIDAAAKGNLLKVRWLLNKGVGVNARANHPVSQNITALIVAAFNGHKRTVALLMKRGADLNAQDTDGDTPLTSAMRQGHLKIAQNLIHAGANPDITNNKGYAPKEMIKSGRINLSLDTNKPDSKRIKTQKKLNKQFLKLIKNKNAFDIGQAQTLIDRGAEIDYTDKHGTSGLILSTSTNLSFKHIEFFIRNNADINFVSPKTGGTALTWALKNKNLLVAEFLLSQGADPLLKGIDNKTPLEFAESVKARKIITMIEAKTNPDKFTVENDKSVSSEMYLKASETSIKTVFDFHAERVITITTNGLKSEAPHIQQFHEISDKSQIIKAAETLKNEGGNPGPWAEVKKSPLKVIKLPNQKPKK